MLLLLLLPRVAVIMFAAALFILLTFVHSVVCQFGPVPDYDGNGGPGFKPDALISVRSQKILRGHLTTSNI